MFGHQDDKSPQKHHKSHKDTDETSEESVQGDHQDQEVKATEFAAANHDLEPSIAPYEQIDKHSDTPTPTGDDPEQIKDVISPAGGYPRSTSSQLPGPGDISNSIANDNTNDGNLTGIIDPPPPTPHELIDIKQKALSELSPLIDQLDQSPEEKFRTIMMMIQASDDQTLVKAAYKAAHAIKDEKTHAQALLDIVNEINYFTQQPEK